MFTFAPCGQFRPPNRRLIDEHPTHTDQSGQKFTANGNGAVPSPGSTVTAHNGSGQIGNAIWNGTHAVVNK